MPFQQESDPLAGGRRHMLHFLAEDPADAAPGFEVAHQDIDGRGLAGAVLSQEADNAAGVDFEIEVFVDFPLPVIVGKVFTGNDRGHNLMILVV